MERKLDKGLLKLLEEGSVENIVEEGAVSPEVAAYVVCLRDRVKATAGDLIRIQSHQTACESLYLHYKENFERLETDYKNLLDTYRSLEAEHVRLQAKHSALRAMSGVCSMDLA